MRNPFVSALFRVFKKTNKWFQWMDFGINSVHNCSNGDIYKQLLPKKAHTNLYSTHSKPERYYTKRNRKENKSEKEIDTDFVKFGT